jgi:hypothetical protein
MKPCKEWRRYLNAKGYGQTRVKDPRRRSGWRTVYMHRLEWEKHHGCIPAGMFVCHRCDNRACYEITHLFIGTPADNNRDMWSKGRGVSLPGEGKGVVCKLTVAKVKAIRREFAAGASKESIGRKYGVSGRHVGSIVSHDNWCHI